MILIKKYLRGLPLLCSLSLTLINTGCKVNQKEKSLASPNLVINIDPSVTYQEIDGFGASDAWSCKFVGRNWPEAKKQQVADWLFSQDTTDEGNPKGIGLSIWRFNLGAGSYEQGHESHISDPWRREECFLSSDGTYDWSKQAGQQWFLDAARQRGTEQVVMFSNSPPVNYTKNGKAFSAGGSHMNIKPGHMDDFAAHLANVVEHFEKKGIHIDYVSPTNEPQWAWKAGSNGRASQEGTPASNEEVANLAELLSGQLDQKELSAQITLSEAGEIDYLYETKDTLRDNQIEDYFSGASENYIGGLQHIAPLICTHSYFSVYPISKLISTRNEVKSKIGATNNRLKYWESEYCILEDSNKDMRSGHGRDLSIDLALYVDRIIHYALSTGNASSWQWWTAISKYNYKDGLIYLDDSVTKGSSDPEYCRHDGEIHDSKLMWGLGNYSLFVRPGMYRVSTGSKDILPNQEYGVFPTAFVEPASGKLVVVVINYSSEPQTIALNLKTGGFKGKVTAYVTSATENLTKTGGYEAEEIALPAHSITTLVGKYKP